MSAKRKTTTVEAIRELQRAVQQLQTAIAAHIVQLLHRIGKKNKGGQKSE